MTDSWINHPSLAHISRDKLLLLNQLGCEGSCKNAAQLLPFLMSILNSPQGKKLSFSQDEISAILQVMKENKSPAELAKMNKILSLAQNL